VSSFESNLIDVEEGAGRVNMKNSEFPLGTVIAERQVPLYDQTGQQRMITVRLGAPVRVRAPDDSLRFFRCPLQIAGLDHDERVFAPAGEDAFVALQYSLDFIGDLLKGGADRLGLQNRNRMDPSTRDHWIWRCLAHQSDAANH
jgi:hypothetical protein